MPESILWDVHSGLVKVWRRELERGSLQVCFSHVMARGLMDFLLRVCLWIWILLSLKQVRYHLVELGGREKGGRKSLKVG